MPIRGSINMHGDKSISHRALLISSLIPGQNNIKNLSTAEDVLHTLKCLNDIGIISSIEKNNIVIIGRTFSNPNQQLFCGNSGTTMRLLSGLLVGLNIIAKLDGDESLQRRPMDRILRPLKIMGANISSANSKAPILIKKSDAIKDLNYNMDIASAQVKSALLLAGVASNKKVHISEENKSRDHTEIMLNDIGYDLNIKGNSIIYNRTFNKPNNIDIDIPGDISSASFFIGAACMIPNSDLRINNVLINDTRMGFINVLKKMDAGIIIHNPRYINGEKIGDIQVHYKPLYGVDINSTDIPSIIDELPILAVVATQAEGITRVSGAEELRYKESDRIFAVVENLKKMGVKVIEKKDGFVIEGPSILSNAAINSYDDHRIAMAFIIAGISSGNYNEIDNIDCIKISYPEFLETLKRIIR